MNRAVRIAALVATLVVLPVGHAGAGTVTPVGQTCGFGTLPDPGGGGWTAVFDAGPLAVTGPDGVPLPLALTVKCSIQAAPNFLHADPEVAAASASGVGVVVLPPTPVPFAAPPEDLVVLCTELVVTDGQGGTTHLYLDEWGHDWSTSPGYCTFPMACTTRSHSCEHPVETLIRLVNEVSIEYVDPALCPTLEVLFPGGDVPDLWDCPPYGA